MCAHGGNSDVNVMEVANCFLKIGLKANSRGGNLLCTVNLIKNLWLRSSSALKENLLLFFLNGHSIKLPSKELISIPIN